jgi:hypothetical protein
VPGPVRSPPATPGTAPASRWPVSVQAVRSVLRRGRPLLHGGSAASTAIRSTPDRGEVAPQRGKAPRAGSWGCWAARAARRDGRRRGAGRGMRGRPRRGTCRRGPSPTSRAGAPPNGPAPTAGRQPPGRRPAGRPARPESPPTGTRWGSGTTTTRDACVVRAIGAGCTERSGTVRTAPVREPAGRWAEGRRTCGRRPAMVPSARSRTSISPARLRPCPCGAGAGDMRAAVARSLMSPPEVMSAAGEGAADKEKGKDRRTVSTAFPTPT